MLTIGKISRRIKPPFSKLVDQLGRPAFAHFGLLVLGINQLKARMRQVVWQEATQGVVKGSHENPVIRRLEKLLAV